MPRSRQHSASHGLSSDNDSAARAASASIRAMPSRASEARIRAKALAQGSAGRRSSGIIQRFDPDSCPVLAEGTVAIRQGHRGRRQAERRGGGDLLVAEAVQPAPDGGEAASVEIVGEAVADQLGRTLDVPRRDAVLDRLAEVQAFGVPGARPAVQRRLALRLTVTQLRLRASPRRGGGSGTRGRFDRVERGACSSARAREALAPSPIARARRRRWGRRACRAPRCASRTRACVATVPPGTRP